MEESWQELLQISWYFYQQYFWDIAFNKAIFCKGLIQTVVICQIILNAY